MDAIEINLDLDGLLFFFLLFLLVFIIACAVLGFILLLGLLRLGVGCGVLLHRHWRRLGFLHFRFVALHAEGRRLIFLKRHHINTSSFRISKFEIHIAEHFIEVAV